ncbi:MAG: glutamine--tRNA ligase [Candidatus Muiribacterium halophilum]|uniref:Glutamine--tRNA ligase n=1 Tax=Muiribacterium halophilum TaxID=2053465 RepID=A0A2N5ZKE6_MUIH1|nr:MAG: glutamine--tRNA ligase [Candidatus Muirbacterium halophilum]
MTENNERNLDFIREIIKNDLESGKHKTTVTRFPPEPNGFLHIGHAKAICLNYGISKENEGARFHLRFDDTNPEKEEVKYIEAIKKDLEWLGVDWGENLFYASDYFDKLYEYAIILIKDGKAYVDELNAEEIREYRGTLTKPGKNSPYRDRNIEENLELFEKMRSGEVEEGKMVLRAKIDMASPNINMRDPVIYRIKNIHHPRTGDKWCIYPMYDYTHCISDALENITHSLCTLEFEDHRPLYDWFLDQLPVPSHPRQIEFARLNLNYTVMSKRHLLKLVEENHVDGWDDPRMPTISGLRRRGYTSASIWEFLSQIGLAKVVSTVDIGLLEYFIRQELNKTSDRVLVVLDPLKVVITNYPDDKEDEFELPNNPEDENAGTRKVKFTKELYIERGDFMEDPPKKFFRLFPGKEVRLKSAYLVRCNDVIKDDNGNITEIHCTYDPDSKGGSAPDGRKVKGTLHWVSAKYGKKIEVRMFDRLFNVENPGKETGDYIDDLNRDSKKVLKNSIAEPGILEAEKGKRFQFFRHGYFFSDPIDSTEGSPVFNQIVSLKDTWEKVKKK